MAYIRQPMDYPIWIEQGLPSFSSIICMHNLSIAANGRTQPLLIMPQLGDFLGAAESCHAEDSTAGGLATRRCKASSSVQKDLSRRF